MSSEDEDTHKVLFLVLALAVAATVFGVVGRAVLGNKASATHASSATAAAPVGSAVAAAVAAAADPAARPDASAAAHVLAGTVFFAVGQSTLNADGQKIVAAAADQFKAAAGGTLILSGFHDVSGDAAQNAEISKRRAFAVRDALIAKGVAATQINLEKPADMLGGGDPAQARRVEIKLTH